MAASASAVIAALAACSPPPPEAPVLAPAPMRDPTRPVASIAGFDAVRLGGAWVLRGGYPEVAPARLAILPGRDGIDILWPDGERERLRQTAPGRYAAAGTVAEEALWVLWIDSGDRTALVGTPSGSRLYLLDRDGTGGGDRLGAATSIAAFYGYTPPEVAA